MDYPAKLYKALHVGSGPDVDFYRRVCTGASSVLEFGCGWGRVCGPIAKDGVRVVGIDTHEEMLSLAEPSLDLRVDDMCTVNLGETFDRVIIPYNGIYACLTKEAQLQAFAAAARHLRVGGLLVFDGYSADQFHEASDSVPDTSDEASQVGTVEYEDVTYDVFEKSTWDKSRQYILASYTHVPRQQGVAKILTEIPQRYLLREELAPMLESAGLELQVVHGGFDQHVWDEDSSMMIVTATKL